MFKKSACKLKANLWLLQQHLNVVQKYPILKLVIIEYRFLDYAIESTASSKSGKLRELNFTQICL